MLTHDPTVVWADKEHVFEFDVLRVIDRLEDPFEIGMLFAGKLHGRFVLR
jgi:hypothetical protein